MRIKKCLAAAVAFQCIVVAASAAPIEGFPFPPHPLWPEGEPEAPGQC